MGNFFLFGPAMRGTRRLIGRRDASFAEQRGRVLTNIILFQTASARINRARDPRELFASALEPLHEALGSRSSHVLLLEDATKSLSSVASCGPVTSPFSEPIALGEGPIGSAARDRRILSRDLKTPHATRLLTVPLVFHDRLLGMLAFEAEELNLGIWHETVLKILADQLALGLERLAVMVSPVGKSPISRSSSPHVFAFHAESESMFLDDQYLVRSIPGKILWRVLGLFAAEGRRRFSNKELRVDSSIGLPRNNANLESRLSLLRRRLAEKCPKVRLLPTSRGQFELSLDCPIELLAK
jgi:adenylate cyclase